MRARFVLITAVVTIATLLGAAPHNTPATEAAGPGTWTAAANMPLPRSNHGSTLLPNGKVLITSGSNNTVGQLQTSATYDPVANTWAAGANQMSVPHNDTDPVLLRDGRVLLIGGGSPPSAHVVVDQYTTGTNMWSAAPSMTIGRASGHTSTMLLDGRVLVVGGSTSPAASTSAEIFDPVTNTWSSAAPMLETRSEHVAALLNDGRVLVAGGYQLAVTASAEIYDPATNTWTLANPMLTPRSSAMVSALPGGRLLVMGGFDGVTTTSTTTSAEIFDPTSGAWTTAGDMDEARIHAAAVLLGNGKVLVGMGDENAAVYLSSAQLYDPVTNTWSSTGSSSIGRNNTEMTLMRDGRVLLTGGYTATGPTANAELYDSTAWLPVSAPATPRLNHTATLLNNGKVLVAAGGSTAAELYEEATNSWSPAGTMTTSREYHAAVRLNDGRVLITGGQLSGTSLLSAETYSPATNAWTAVASPSIARAGATALVLPDGRVALYGGEGSGRPEIYTPATNTWLVGSANPNVGAYAGRAAVSTGGKIVTLDNGASSLYDPATDVWTSIASYPGAFFPGTMTQLEGSSRAVTAGGTGVCPPGQLPPIALAARFDIVGETWSSATWMSTARIGHTATALYDGRLLVAGGNRSTAGCFAQPQVTQSSSEIYNDGTNTWTSAGNMTAARTAHTATRLASGNVLVVGGRDGATILPTAEKYDLGVNTDTDGDGYNDGLELALNQHPWLNCKTMRADVTGDGIANVADIGLVASKTGQKPAPGRIDQNGDKIINVADVGLTASQSGKSVLMCL